MTEAFRELLRFAFEENGVCRVTTGCDRENKGSENVMIKCGMIKEADMKKKKYGCMVSCGIGWSTGF